MSPEGKEARLDCQRWSGSRVQSTETRVYDSLSWISSTPKTSLITSQGTGWICRAAGEEKCPTNGLLGMTCISDGRAIGACFISHVARSSEKVLLLSASALRPTSL